MVAGTRPIVAGQASAKADSLLAGAAAQSAPTTIASAIRVPREGTARNPADRPCPGPPSVVSDRVTEWPDYQAAAAETKFDTRLGLLGGELDRAELCVRAIGPYSPAGAALPDGSV